MSGKLVPSTVRLLEEEYVAMDRLIKILGGNRSDFVRLAVAERIERLEKLLYQEQS